MKITFRSRNNRLLNIAPTRLIVISFAAIIFIGAWLLTFPFAAKSGQPTPFIDALFTATSATCVTGLIVYDTLNHWTVAGQIIILSLIQIGGLGIITLATFFAAVAGRKVGLRGMLLAQESLNHFSYQNVIRLIKRVVLVTFGVELAGALLMAISFCRQFGLQRGFYMGVFHSVSAFCNAGFDIIGDFRSMTDYNNDPIVIYTITGLIILGGLGFIVWQDVYDSIRERRSPGVHTKLVLMVSAILAVLGTVFFFVSEFNNPLTMGHLNGVFEKFNAAWFHSIVPRTAGFNSLPTNDMTDSSKLFTVILMFIGAAPGSTGGGIKVTTFGVLIVAIYSQMKGNDDVVLFKHRISPQAVNKALAITGMAFLLVISVTMLLLSVENGPMISTINTMYESVSAFATVGLSTGITPSLHLPSKLALIFTMFLGRVGPLSFAVALTLRSREHQTNVVHPEGKIVVG